MTLKKVAIPVYYSAFIVGLEKHAHRIIFFKRANPAYFLFISSLFKQAIQFLQQINVKIVRSIQYLAPGFEPTTERESPPITTRPGLPSRP